MPISEKIKRGINELSVSEEEKQLLMDILEIEDKASFRYQADYKQVINGYIKKAEEGDENQ